MFKHLFLITLAVNIGVPAVAACTAKDVESARAFSEFAKKSVNAGQTRPSDSEKIDLAVLEVAHCAGQVDTETYCKRGLELIQSVLGHEKTRMETTFDVDSSISGTLESLVRLRSQCGGVASNQG